MGGKALAVVSHVRHLRPGIADVLLIPNLVREYASVWDWDSLWFLRHLLSLNGSDGNDHWL